MHTLSVVRLRSRAAAFLLVLMFPALACPAAERILIAFGATHGNLFISQADGSGERPLTNAGSFDFDPAWSMQDDWIVFTREQDGGAGHLFRIHPDGTGLDQLTDSPAYDDQAAFSPDGARIVFVSTRGTGMAALWLLDLATRVEKPLTSGRGGDFRPAWSPDGQWIAFSSGRGDHDRAAKGRWERSQLLGIYLVRPDGTGLRRISERGYSCAGPEWTRGGKSVIASCMSEEETLSYRFPLSAFMTSAESHLVKIDVATGAMTPVPASHGLKIAGAVLPSGETAYVRLNGPGGIYYTSGKTGPAGPTLYSPAWSADGTRVSYCRVSFNSSDEPTKRWSRSPKYELFNWQPNLGTAYIPSYDPTGRHIAASVYTYTSDRKSNLVIFEKGRPPKVILEHHDVMPSPQWSPDGGRIIVGVGGFNAFMASKPGPVKGATQLGLLNADGSGFHLITSGPNNNAFASFAPDGRRIVYRTEGPEGLGLRIMNLEDHSITALTHEYDDFPAWSPRGDLISFTRKIGDFFEVLTIRPDGTGTRQLTHTRGNDAHASWSPDGEWLVFSSTRMGFKDELLRSRDGQPNGEIFVMRYDGTHVEQLTDDPWEDRVAVWIPHEKVAATLVK